MEGSLAIPQDGDLHDGGVGTDNEVQETRLLGNSQQVLDWGMAPGRGLMEDEAGGRRRGKAVPGCGVQALFSGYGKPWHVAKQDNPGSDMSGWRSE